MEKITSKTNSLIKDTKKLMTSSSARGQRELFVLEGARLCFDVLNSDFKVKYLLVTDRVQQKYGEEVAALAAVSDGAFVITDEIAAKLSDTTSPQGIFAVCKMQTGERGFGAKVLALDNVQDPSNVGAIIRTAEALGIDTVLVGGGCDVYNPKALRASMGSVLRQNIVTTVNLAETLNSMKNSFSVFATVPKREAEKITGIDFSAPCICVIGNEANGISDAVLDVADKLITIPMPGRAESLNASVAASITMWEMMR